MYITAFILALLISPSAVTNSAGIGFIIFASVWAMASKFIFAIHKKHIFNPAAFGIALSALVLNQSATWWAGGSIVLLPFVFFGGLLIVRKIRRFDLVASFSIVALVTILATSGGNYMTPLTQALFYSPFFFLAFVMLTEPLTMPPTRLADCGMARSSDFFLLQPFILVRFISRQNSRSCRQYFRLFCESRRTLHLEVSSEKNTRF